MDTCVATNFGHVILYFFGTIIVVHDNSDEFMRPDCGLNLGRKVLKMG